MKGSIRAMLVSASLLASLQATAEGGDISGLVTDLMTVGAKGEQAM